MHNPIALPYSLGLVVCCMVGLKRSGKDPPRRGGGGQNSGYTRSLSYPFTAATFREKLC